jgi:hypothetical protein
LIADCRANITTACCCCGASSDKLGLAIDDRSGSLIVGG